MVGGIITDAYLGLPGLCEMVPCVPILVRRVLLVVIVFVVNVMVLLLLLLLLFLASVP
jgi:hypothetical protein